MILTLQFCYRSFFVPDLETGWCVCYTQGGRSLCLQAVFYRSSAYLEGGVSVIREPAGGSIQSTSDMTMIILGGTFFNGLPDLETGW